MANIGNIFNNGGFYFKAISYLNKSLKIDSDSQYTHDRLASALKKQNDENAKAEEIEKKGQRASSQITSTPIHQLSAS